MDGRELAGDVGHLDVLLWRYLISASDPWALHRGRKARSCSGIFLPTWKYGRFCFAAVRRTARGTSARGSASRR